MIRRVVVVLALLAAHRAPAQDTSALRLHLALGDQVEAGHPAPAVILPYATADSIGPTAQPFDLAKELGHVVVLVLTPSSRTSPDDWHALASHWPAPLPTDVAIAAVSTASLADDVQLARTAHAAFKWLFDAGGAVMRRYGAPPNAIMVVVVGRDGVVRFVNAAFQPRARDGFVTLDAAIAAAKRR